MASISALPFVEQIETEAMALLVETRDAGLVSLAKPRATTDSSIGGVLVDRHSELTAILCWVVAWVYYQKAVCAGELTRDDVLHSHLPLGPFVPLPDQASRQAMGFPESLADRLARGRALHERAIKLAPYTAIASPPV